MSAEQLHSCFLVNVYIFCLAVSLNIPVLKQHSIHKFKKRLEDSCKWSYYKFTEVVATILSETTDNDDGLRSTILELLIRHASEVLGQHDPDESPYHEGREKWMKVLSEHPGFVLDL